MSQNCMKHYLKQEVPGIIRYLWIKEPDLTYFEGIFWFSSCLVSGLPCNPFGNHAKPCRWTFLLESNGVKHVLAKYPNTSATSIVAKASFVTLVAQQIIEVTEETSRATSRARTECFWQLFESLFFVFYAIFALTYCGP